MTNFHRIYHDRAEFTNKKVQDLLKAANEAMFALQASVQCSNGAFFKEDVQPLLGTLRQAYEAISHLGTALTSYETQLPSRVQRQQLTNQMHSMIAQAITTGQRRIAPEAIEEDL